MASGSWHHDALMEFLMPTDVSEESNLEQGGTSEKSGVFFVNIPTKAELYRAYMPFVLGGGLFIPTNRDFGLGDEVFMLVNLMGEPEKIPVAGEVVWLTPKCAQGGREAGIGVRFTGDDGDEVRNKIETYLAGALNSENHTDTI